MELVFLQDLAVVMMVAALAAILFARLGQPTVLGFIFAGLLIGPHTPPFALVSDQQSIRSMSDLGVTLLMFAIGLDFNLRKLHRVGGIALLVALLDVVVMTGLGFVVGRVMGWGVLGSLFLGAAICDSSSVILGKMIKESHWGHRRFAELSMGITVVEDVLAIFVIALLNALALGGAMEAAPLANQAASLAIYLTAAMVFGLLLVPRFLNRLDAHCTEEVLLLAVLGLCFGMSLLAVKLKFSLALGAFLIGAVASESRARYRIERLTEPLRLMFSAIFFVSVGLMIEPAQIMNHWVLIVLLSLLVIGGKFINCTMGCILAGQPPSTSIRVGIPLAQVGEFAFIIAAMGETMGVTSDDFYPTAVMVAVTTTLASPYLMRLSDPLVNRLAPLGQSRLGQAMDLYRGWLTQITSVSSSSVVGGVIRRSLRIIGINLGLIAALFATAAVLDRMDPFIAAKSRTLRVHEAIILWCVAAALCLPLYVATMRKWQALSMLFSEMIIPPGLQSSWARHVRGFITHVLTLLGLAGLVLLTVALSAPMTFSPLLLALLLLLAVLVMALRWRSLSAAYARAQASLADMLSSQPAEPPREEGRRMLMVNTATIELHEKSPAVGRRLADMNIRLVAGASVISILRGLDTVINPAPHEKFQAGDQLIVLGNPDQIEAARTLLMPR